MMVRQMAFLVLFCMIFALILPVSVYLIMNINSEKKDNEVKNAQEISVLFTDENKVRKMPMEEYLYGVVSAEMPAEFETEALKAQAVAARSYAIYRSKNQNGEHPDASVCTNSAHCKAYKSEEQTKEEWKDKAKIYKEKIKNAVDSTAGEVITYQGEVAMAVFHSQSGSGRTENSSDVWGGEVPYLVSVESHGEENAPNFYSSVVVSFDEFREKILSENPSAKIDSKDDITDVLKSEGGSVKSITIGGEKFTGRKIREIFSLRSSCFKINADENSVSFEVTGYGHGVGMSQYGANTMAKEGFDYKDILTHYYSGTEIEGV